MPFVAFQPFQRRHGEGAAAQKIGDGEKSEVHASQRRGQPQSDVGGRGSLRHFNAQRQLRIIGRQPVGFGVYEIVEISPCPARQATQKLTVLREDAFPLEHGDGPVEPPHQQGRGDP
jgi:hypothetical protein